MAIRFSNGFGIGGSNNGGGGNNPTPTGTPEPTVTSTPTPTGTPEPTPTPSEAPSECSGDLQNVAGTNGLVGFFFGGFPTPLGVVQVGWYANGAGVTDALVTNIDSVSELITIASGNGEFVSGVSYNFCDTPQFPNATPMPTSTATMDATPEPTGTSAPNPTGTPSPTGTSAPNPTGTPSPTGTSAPNPTPTATSASAPMTVTIYESGSNVVMSASGTVDLSGLTLVNSNFGPFGTGGLGISTATFISGPNTVYGDTYSGFTSTPSNFGSGSGGANSSGSGHAFGIIVDQNPPYLLVVPTGYTSGENISSTQTFNNTSLSTLGLTNGTYTYTWSGGSIDVVVGGTPGPTPTPTTTSVGGGIGAWYFYSDEGALNTDPPLNPGNVIFLTSAGGNETFNPNRSSGTNEIYLNRYDDSGTDYGTQFNNLMVSGGTISIIQNGQTATFSTSTAYQFQYNSASNGFLMIPNTVNQTVSTASSFVYGDPISLSFS